MGAGVIILLLFSGIAIGGTFDMTMEITATVSADATVNEDPWDNTGLTVSENNVSASDQVNIDNTGDVPIDVAACCTDTTDWAIAASPTTNVFQLRCKETVAGSYVNLANGYATVYSNMGTTEDKDFTFQVYTPTVSTHYDLQTATITFMYTQYT